MKVILESQDKFSEIAILDVASGTFEITQKPEKKIETNGYYSNYDGSLVTFFRLNQNLYFGVDKQIIQFKENDRVSISPLSNGHSQFSIWRDKENIFNYEYESHHITPPISAFQIVNPIIGEEEFNIFLFVYNAINDKERKERVFRHLG